MGASGIRPSREKQIPPFDRDDTKFIFGVQGEVALPRVARAVLYAALWASSSTFSLGQVARSRTFPEFEEMWT
jgi:hypothetical protein